MSPLSVYRRVLGGQIARDGQPTNNRTSWSRLTMITFFTVGGGAGDGGGISGPSL